MIQPIDTAARASQIGHRLAQSRLAAKITQQQAGEAIGVTRQAISLWERSGEIKANHLKQLCELYGASADFILFGIQAAYWKATVGRMEAEQ